jgi:hypothetical protein
MLKLNVPIATLKVILIIHFWASGEGEGQGLWGGVNFPLNFSCHFLQPPHRGSILLSPKGWRHTSTELSFIFLFLFFQLSLAEHLHQLAVIL